MPIKNIKNFAPQKNSKFKQGYYDKYNPIKYYGDRPIIYRSSWELKFMRICELNSEVLKWSSESITIPYTMKEKVNGKFVEKRHNYTPDFVVHLKNGNTILIEVKPLNQIPLNESQLMRDSVQYKNARKWKAAIQWCKQNNYKFMIVNENHLKTKIF